MWMQTFTGKRICPQALKVEDINIEDIAHSLSMTCRFNGHCNQYYSVAEHCVRLSLMEDKSSPQWRLLHDASEAYIGDIITPVKSLLRTFSTLENTIHLVIAKRFGLDIKDYNYAVMSADMKLLATEARDLMNADPIKDWKMKTSPLPDKIIPWTIHGAKKKFLDRAIELGIK